MAFTVVNALPGSVPRSPTLRERAATPRTAGSPNRAA